uniref:Uncharacterized protein n=1 Tax=Steinernema glaseri TaxID=37863 RepID=A0A1I7ZG94_9BILA
MIVFFSSILVLLFLSSEVVVRAEGNCWTDRIFAFSGTAIKCNATRRCVNEAVLLDYANKECGQPVASHSFQESCGTRQYFSIDYTCCAHNKYREECVEVGDWSPENTDKWMNAMKKTMQVARAMHEARGKGDNTTANMIEEKKLLPAIEEYERESQQLSPSLPYYHRTHARPGCADTTHIVGWKPQDNSYISRLSTFFALKSNLQIYAHICRYTYLPMYVIRLARSGLNCTKKYYAFVRNVGPVDQADVELRASAVCDFFPELKEETMDYAFKMSKNTSFGFEAPERDFWIKEGAEQRYCEWFVEKFSGPERIHEKGFAHLKALLGFTALLATASVLCKYWRNLWDVASLTLLQIKPQQDTTTQDEAPTVIYQVFHNDMSAEPESQQIYFH